MITTVVTGLICLLVGFGVGRIKNAGKLAKIKEAIGGVEKYTTSEARAMYAMIAKHLVILFALLILGTAIFAQSLPDTPAAKAVVKDCPVKKPLSAKKLLLWDGASFLSSGFNSAGSYYGALRCIHENDSRFVPPGPGQLTPKGEFEKTLKRSLPVDAAAAGVSALLHHFHHDRLALMIPMTSSSAQMGIFATQLSAGCF